MENKTPETDNKSVETPRQTSQERIADLITARLEAAKTNGGFLINADQKTKPGIYNSALQQSAFSKALIAMHSDNNDFKTNVVTFFSDAKNRGESVLSGQKGLPLPWYSWTHFEKKDDPSVSISRSEYLAMPKEEQANYKGIRNKEMRIVFNIDQTNLSTIHPEEYGKQLEQNGSVQERTVDANTDKNLRIVVNQYILNVRDNLVPIKKDGNGIASYDKANDAVHIPAQNAYNSYPEYVQDVSRQIIAATAHPQRLNRHSSQRSAQSDALLAKNYDTLVTELASAIKQVDYGLPAKLSPKAMENVDAIIDMLKKNPALVDSIENDVNKTMSMIQKAERGEKIEKRPTQSDIERWRSKLPKEGTVPDMFDAVLMMKDDKGKWSLYVKPENENGFAVHPDPKDVSMFFNIVKGQGPLPTGQDAEHFVANFRKEMGQKYYADVAKNPDHAINLFGTDASKEIVDKLEKVNIFKTKDETPRILMVATVDGGDHLKAKELTPDQWQRIWLAPDMKEYKKNLGATHRETGGYQGRLEEAVV